MTLTDVIDFTLLSRYDGKIRDWVLALVPTADVLYTAEDQEVIDGDKQIGDVKVPGHNGLISKAQLEKLVKFGLKLKKSSTDIASLEVNADGTYTIDVSSKADKVSGATEGNFAGLDSSGNITDSGKNATNFATDTQGGYADSALQTLSKGTDGEYVTTTIGDKVGENGSKSQTIATALKIVDINSATSENNGLATANDVKTFVGAKVAAAIEFRGNVENYSELLSIENPSAGDMYNVQEDETVSNVFYPGEMNYAWVAPVLYAEGDEIPEGKSVGDIKVAGRWDPQAPTVKIVTATEAQIDSLFN